MNVAGVATAANATDATSITTGGLIASGGLGIAKALWVGGLANIAGAVTLQSTGPHAIGGATDANTALYMQGTFAGSTGTVVSLLVAQTLTPTANNNSYGVYSAPTFNKAGSGTHPLFAAIHIVPSFGAGASTITDVVGINIPAFAAPASTTTATGIRIAGPTTAATNWALSVTSGATNLQTVFAALTNANAQDYVCYNTGTKELEQNATVCNLSTERVKDGILVQMPEDMLAVALKLIPVSFILKAHPELGPRLGFTAQKTEPVDARLVTYFASGDWAGELRGVDYDGSTAVFAGAIQAQQRIIEMLDARITALANRASA